MPANFDSGFCVRTPSWHRQETLLADYPGSWEEARKLAGLDWDPTSEPVFNLVGISDDGQPIYEPIPGWQQIKRSDTGATLSLNHDAYEVISNTEMGGIIEAVLEQPNVKWETAGSLEGGKSVWCLALLDEPVTLPGDISVTLPYMAVTNRHDATRACSLRATSVRIVCANTFSAAELEGDRTGAKYSFRHTKNWRDRVSEARDAVTGARREFQDYVKLATSLLGVKVTPAQRELFVTEFVPMPPAGLVSDRVAKNVEEARSALRMIFESSTTAPVADSMFGLVHAAGEYLDHVRTARTWEARLNRTLLRPESMKARALTLAREVVNN
jgi:phage/plasmid-like protein (TIGR03299 family)